VHDTSCSDVLTFVLVSLELCQCVSMSVAPPQVGSFSEAQIAECWNYWCVLELRASMSQERSSTGASAWAFANAPLAACGKSCFGEVDLPPFLGSSVVFPAAVAAAANGVCVSAMSLALLRDCVRSLSPGLCFDACI